MSDRSKYLDFIQFGLPSAILEGVELCFDDKDVDPEAAWAEFRDGLRKIKKKHIELYLKYEESDDDTLLPESEISKWRRENNHGNL